MCAGVSDWLHARTNGWIALMGVLAFLLFAALVLPGQSAQVKTYSGDAGSPDMSFVYSPGDLYDMAEAYGEEGRRAYVRARFTFDLAFPLVFTFFLATAITWLCGRAFKPGSRWRRANLVPLLGGLFDYLENLSASLVVARYPARTAVVDWLVPAFTLLKWIFVGCSFLALLAGVVLALRKWLRRGGEGRAGAP